MRAKEDYDEPTEKPTESKRELESRRLLVQIESLELKNKILENKLNEKPEKKKTGRPEKYANEFHPLLARLFYGQGGVDVDFAEYIGISEPTIHAWKKKYPDFAKAVKEGKLNPDIKMEAALYKSGLDGSNTAQIYWLKNRMPERWRDQQHIELTGKDGGPIITKQERSERLKELLEKRNETN